MKPLSFLFCLSIAANLALGYALLNARKAASPASAAVGTATASTAATGDLASRAAIADALTVAAKTRDLRTLRDQLRALGMPDDVVRGIIRALVYKRFSDQQASILGTQNAPFWKSSPGFSPFGTMTKEQRLKMQEANRAAMKEMDDLVGPDPQDPMYRRVSFLPPEKASKVRDLERDYMDLRSQIMSEAEGFHVPADQEKLSFLEKEQRKDLAAILTPEELEAYDMRNSNTANRLRYQLRDFDVSESEYKTIFDAQKAFDDKFAGNIGTNGPTPKDQAQARAQAQEAMNAAIKETLGEDRYNAYMRSQNQEYRALQAAAKRFNLPDETVNQVYSLRDQTVANAQRIANDANLNDEQRRQALAALGQQTVTQIKSSLGQDVADAYLRTNMRWLDGLQKGQTISVTPEGYVIARPPAAPPVSRPSLPPAPGTPTK